MIMFKVLSISLFLGEAVTGKRGRRGLFYQPLDAVGQVSDGFAGAKIERKTEFRKFIVLLISNLCDKRLSWKHPHSNLALIFSSNMERRG